MLIIAIFIKSAAEPCMMQHAHELSSDTCPGQEDGEAAWHIVFTAQRSAARRCVTLAELISGKYRLRPAIVST